MAAAGYNDWITKGGARIDDLGRDLQKIIEEKKFMFDDQDEPTWGLNFIGNTGIS